MSKLEQAKMLMKVKKLQKELQKETLTTTAGDGAVKVEINGEMKIKKISLDKEKIDFDDIRELERWIEDAIKDAINQSQKMAADKMKPVMGMLGDLGL